MSADVNNGNAASERLVEAATATEPSIKSQKMTARKEKWREFCYLASAHGFPLMSSTKSVGALIFWVVWYLICTGMCAFQIYAIVQKYQSYSVEAKTIEVTEAPLFPAVTACNLNPYKESAARTNPLMDEILTGFDERMTALFGYKPKTPAKFKQNYYEPAHTHCECAETETNARKCYKEQIPTDQNSTCVCLFDRITDMAQACYQKDLWEKEMCTACDEMGLCYQNNQSVGALPCLCSQPAHQADVPCVARTKRKTINLWDYYETLDARSEALGLHKKIEKKEIVAQTKENLEFAAAALTEDERGKIAYGRSEFISDCSFGGTNCDLERSVFTTFIPSLGNCFTFKFNETAISSPGPASGLELQFDVKLAEYLPTTQSAGVSLVIHEHDTYPSLDTDGFTIQTGVMTSVGIGKTRFLRLSAPFGSCELAQENSLFPNHNYSIDICHQSCHQQAILSSCGCASPKYPLPDGAKYCRATDPHERKCLSKHESHKSFDCKCQKPCDQTSYSWATHSTATWPLHSHQLERCTDGSKECVTSQKESVTLVRIYFSCLSFTLYTEHASYAMVEMFRDIGFVIMLYLGINLVNFWELFIFVIQLCCSKNAK